LDRGAGSLLLKAQKGFPECLLSECESVPVGRCICGQAALEKKTQFHSHITVEHEITYKNMPPHGHYCVPILSKDTVLGVINIFLNEGYVRDNTKENFLHSIASALAGIITHKNTQQELLRTHKDLHDAKRLSDIGMLAATVAHELRNPLAAIHMASYNIKRKAQNPLLDRHLLNIKTKVAESNQIINNLLFHSRIKKPHFEAVDLSAIMDECLDVARKRAVRKKAVIRKKYRFFRGVPVEADPVQIRELFVNILNNAFDALNESGIVEVGALRPSDGLLKMYFRDTGIGMDAQHLKQVHEPFFTTKAKGTGLGLAVSLQIVNMHSGKIEIASRKGKGTTVFVTLPVRHTDG